MIRVALILAGIGLILIGLWWAYQWLVKNRVRVRMHRAPTGQEMLLFSVILRVIRALIRILFRG